ncbi:hypothetical protein QCD60_09150 [Pokkaliibacter sp. MBI-7]|uniref:hypothetical protein n=1 Tax=Pokkaliibacter sp. MBI-7 TaxID=3040600 RepID=UPI002448DC0C|nr:hypothetical protein [Pokkaliibacter sp. MBI-7]MDH2432732.1 hypothetical protein [Pokkaliibacter sp. MBI-7]
MKARHALSARHDVNYRYDSPRYDSHCHHCRGTVIEIRPGPALSALRLQTRDGIVTALVSSRQLQRLHIRVGSQVGGQLRHGNLLLATH